MDQLKRLRLKKGLSQAKLAARADIDPSTVNQIERGAREASPATLRKLANALDVGIADLLEDAAPKAQASLPFEDGPSLDELHTAARCETNLLIKPEAEWQRTWPPSLTPHEAMQIVQTMADEFAALKPLMAAQEKGLPIYRRAVNGRYKQAWLRFFAGLQAAHECGVASGLITQQETLNDLEKRLGETSGVKYEEMLLAS